MASPAVQDHATFRYSNGFVATGDFQGSCALVGFLFQEGVEGSIVLRHQGGILRVFESRVNQTFVGDPNVLGYASEGSLHQEVTEYAIPPGPTTVSWMQRGHLHALGDLAGRSPAHANMSGSQWDVGPVRQTFTYGPSYPGEIPHGGVGYLEQGIRNWSRALTSPAPSRVGGDIELRFDTAEIRATEFQLTLPPYEQSENERDLRPLAYERTLVLTHAVLELNAAQVEDARPPPTWYCSGIQMHGSGTATFRHASGVVAREEQDIPFDRREFTISGTWSLHEAPGSAGGVVEGVARGRFDAVGFDFAAVPSASSGWGSPVPTATLAALVVAGLTAAFWHSGRLVGLFFSRFSPFTAPRHPARALILDVVRARPGVRLRDVAHEAGINYSVARHHVHVLATVGLVKVVRGHRGPHLYDKAESVALRPELVARHDPLVGHVLRLVPTGGAALGATLRRVAAEAGVSRVGAWKAVVRAEKYGLVRRTRSGFGMRIEWATPSARAPVGPLGEAPRVAVEQGL